jgi:RimJ/RimL family protein N-acetyltransferase
MTRSSQARLRGWDNSGVSDHVILRPVSEDDLPVLHRLTHDPEAAGEFEWAGWSDPHTWRRGWEKNGLLGPDGGTLMVARTQELLGLVNWRGRGSGPAPSRWEIGIALLPQARGKGHGTEAQRQLTRYLFAHTTVHRIEAITATGNIAEQRALEKAGFTKEGVLRGIGWREGAWRDGVLCSILRTDPAG